MEYDVFISYSRKDTAIADRICAAFDRAGISYFIDRQGIAGGMDFPQVLADAIEQGQLFLFLASENSYASKFTNNEVLYAFNEKPPHTLLPYVIDGSRMPNQLRFTFASINVRNITEHPIDTVLVDDVLRLLGRISVSSEKTKKTDSSNLRAKWERRVREENNRRNQYDGYMLLGEGKTMLTREDVPVGVKLVKIADTVTKIDKAFVNCGSLISVEMPDSVTHLGPYAFSGCSGLRSAVLSNSLAEIPQDTFDGCMNLATVKIPSSVTRIGHGAFCGCVGLASVEIPDSVSEIGNYAFFGCGSLKVITIPKSVKKIGDAAFENCPRLKTVRLSSPNTRYRKMTLGSWRVRTFPKGTNLLHKGKVDSTVRA